MQLRLNRNGRRQEPPETANDLPLDAIDEGISLSLATVYNTLSQFDETGLIRKVSANAGKAHCDTDTGDHHHFYIEAEDRITDIEPERISVGGLPTSPAGYEITRESAPGRWQAIFFWPKDSTFVRPTGIAGAFAERDTVILGHRTEKWIPLFGRIRCTSNEIDHRYRVRKDAR